MRFFIQPGDVSSTSPTRLLVNVQECDRATTSCACVRTGTQEAGTRVSPSSPLVQVSDIYKLPSVPFHSYRGDIVVPISNLSTCIDIDEVMSKRKQKH